METATITFRGKIRDVHYPDDSLAYRYIAIPQLRRHHCNMQAFRNHPTYGGYANSDLFHTMLSRIRETISPLGRLRLDSIPAYVSVDSSKFLATVIVNVDGLLQ
jgi:hypothetical protein